MRDLKVGVLALGVVSLAACSQDNTGRTTGGETGVEATGGGTGTTGVGQTTGGDTAGTTGADAPGTTTGPDIPIDDPDPDDTELRIETVDPGVGRAKGGDVISVIGNGFVEDGTGVFFGACL